MGSGGTVPLRLLGLCRGGFRAMFFLLSYSPGALRIESQAQYFPLRANSARPTITCAFGRGLRLARKRASKALLDPRYDKILLLDPSKNTSPTRSDK